MKKNANNVGLLYPFVTSKVWKIMRISLLLLVVGLMHVSAASYSQTKKLNLRGNSFTLKEIFTAIEDQSTYTIFFKDDQVNLEQELSGNFNNQDITGVLDRALEGSNLTYKINDKLIIILENAPNMTQSAQQQDRSIKGKVVGQDGASMPGVNVFVDGTTRGTITNIDGEFELNLEPGDVTLVFSFIGYETQKVAIGERTNVNITLMEESIGLDEVVAIGYGVQKKSDMTGAVASVKSETLTKVAVSNPAEALQGRLAGVSVTSIGGAPGGGMDIKIRGVGTINSNAPLVIIDGVPGSLYMLNPADIASIEVLKDGAAAAIYGTEAANGVILVTTKKGADGVMTIDVSAKFAMQSQTSELDLANSEQYMKVAKMLYDNAGQARPTYLNEPYFYDTDWLDAVYRNAPMQEYTVSLKGGTDKVNYYVSGGWLDQDGTIIGTDFQKANLRSKIDFKGEWLKGGVNVSYNETKSNNLSMNIKEVYEILPIIPVFDDSRPNGFGYADPAKQMPTNFNPVGVEKYRDYWTTDQYLSTVGYLTFDIVKDLNFRVEGGLNNSNKHDFLHHPAYNVDQKQEVLYPGVWENRSNWREININNILSYNKTFGDHDISAMAGYVYKKETKDWMEAGIDGYKEVYKAVIDGDGNPVMEKTEEPTGFLDQYFNTLDSGLDGKSSVGGSRYTYTRASILGRVNYSYKGRYLIQATVRRDGSSKFGEDSRYGTFPSVALGWRLNDEEFMSGIDWLSNLKIRASYGVLGNEMSLGYYDFMPLITSGTTEFLSYSKGRSETIWLGAIAREMENKKLRWETTTSRNIGFDFGVLNNQLSGGLNYYSNLTSDMLVAVPIPSSSGMKTPIVNYGEVQNSGVELELTYQGHVGEFKYNVFGSFGTIKNEVKKLGLEEQSINGEALNFTEHYPNQTRVGYEVGSFFLYQKDGIFQSEDEVNAHKNKDGELLQPEAKPGDIRFKDMDGNGSIGVEDKVYSGTGLPKYNYSLSFDASYKGFDFSMLLYGAGGHKIYNGNRYYYESMRSPRNFFASTANAWTPENKNTDMPRAILGDPNQNSRESTRFLEDGDFLRVKNIQLGYTIPSSLTQRVKIQKARVYVSGQNLFTFTNYSGQDPEVGRSSVFNSGLDRTLYPISKMYLFGVQISL